MARRVDDVFDEGGDDQGELVLRARRAHQIVRPCWSRKVGRVERVVVDPGGFDDLRVGEAVEGRRTVAQIESRCLGSTSAEAARSSSYPRAACAWRDRMRTGSRAAGRRDQSRSCSTRGPPGSGVQVGADDRCRHLLPVRPTAVDRRSDPGEPAKPRARKMAVGVSRSP